MTAVAKRVSDVDLQRLFPRSPSPRLSWRSVLVGVLAVVVGAAVVLARQRGAGALQTVWAEDGEVFLQQARDDGWRASLTASYAGYWHLASRSLALVAAALPLRDADASLAISAAVVQSALAVFIYRASAAVIPSTVLRVLVGGSMVMLPVGQPEVFASIANVHWFLYPAAVWALLWNPTSRIDTGIATVVLVVAALSDPLLALLLPLALLRLVAGRRVSSITPAIAFIAAIVVHVMAVLVVQPEREAERAEGGIGHVVSWFVFDVPGRGVLGTRALPDPDSRAGQAIALAVLLVVAVLLVAGIRRLGADALPALALVASAGVLYLVPTAVAATHPPRYSIGPTVLVLSALASVWPPSPRLSRIGPAVLVGLLLVWGVNLRLTNARAEGPTWETGVVAATESCQSRRDDQQVAVAITPSGWTVKLTCADVR